MVRKYFSITVWVVTVLFLAGCEEQVRTKGDHTPWVTMPSIQWHTAKHNADPQDGNDTNTSTGVDPQEAYLNEDDPSNWYIRLVAEDVTRGLKCANTQLGEVDADDAVAEHTLKAIKPFGHNYLDIVFHNPDDVEPGEYKSSFHRSDNETIQRWRFTVRSSDANADIELSCSGLYVLTAYRDDQARVRYSEHTDDNLSLMQRMKLIDIKTGAEKAVMAGDSPLHYQFNMEGAEERQFEWVVGLIPVVTSNGLQDESASVPVMQQRNHIDHGSRFDLSHPPQTGVWHFNE